MCSPDTKTICADILKRWENLKCMLLETSQNESKVTFMYFEKMEITLKSSKATERVLPIHAYVNIIELLEFFDAPSGKQTKSRLTKTIHHRNLLRNFRNLKPLVLQSFPNLIYLSVDFSENLTVPVQQEPQTLHWYKEQKTIHNIVLKGIEGKSYHPHFSDDLTHAQEFVFVSLREVLDNVDFESENDSMLVLESDNCSNQYKSAKSFYHQQQLSDL